MNTQDVENEYAETDDENFYDFGWTDGGKIDDDENKENKEEEDLEVDTEDKEKDKG